MSPQVHLFGKRTVRCAAALPLALMLAGGCRGGPREPRGVASHDPSAKIPAIKASVENKDLSVVTQLVKDLDSDDPAVRFYAIEGLQRLTGEDFGYKYYLDDAKQRAEAIGKWQAWLAGWDAGQQQAQGESHPGTKR